MNSYASEARSLNQKYARDVQPLLKRIADINTDHDTRVREAQTFAYQAQSPETAHQVKRTLEQQRDAALAPLLKQAQEQHGVTVKAIRAVITAAKLQEVDSRPANADRAAATRDAARKATAADTRRLVDGLGLRDLLPFARQAVKNNDAVLSYALRCELAKHPGMDPQRAEIGALLNEIHDGAHGLALSHVMGAQHILTRAIANGPLLDAAPLFQRDLTVATAANEELQYVDEAGVARSMRADVAAALQEQSGAVDQSPIAARPDTLANLRSYNSLMTPKHHGAPSFEQVLNNPESGLAFANAA